MNSQTEVMYHLKKDEALVIEELRKAKKEKFADLVVKIHDGVVKYINWTHKVELAGGRIQE